MTGKLLQKIIIDTSLTVDEVSKIIHELGDDVACEIDEDNVINEQSLDFLSGEVHAFLLCLNLLKRVRKPQTYEVIDKLSDKLYYWLSKEQKSDMSASDFRQFLYEILEEEKGEKG